MKIIILLIVPLVFIKSCVCSSGDSSPIYLRCLHRCAVENCTSDGSFTESNQQSSLLQLMQWSCEDECRYQCMWRTVNEFEKWNLRPPQFHGKWPFIRILGIQEPASALFSLLNFYAHLKMLQKFRRGVRSDSPFYWLWHTFAYVCLNAWIWSTIFHTRDFPFTELMDYACAFSIILVGCYCMVVRLLINLPRFALVTITTFFMAFYMNHVIYLSKGRFDYGYNMQLNILIGTFTAICWFGWCTWNRIRQPYVWKCAVFVALAGAAMLLEVIDQPPLFWIFDSHSLWHLVTAPLICLFYSFAIDDCKYLRKVKYLDKETEIKSS